MSEHESERNNSFGGIPTLSLEKTCRLCPLCEEQGSGGNGVFSG